MTNRLVKLSDAHEVLSSRSGNHASQGTLLDLRLIGLTFMITRLAYLKQIAALLYAATEASIEALKALAFFTFYVDHRNGS